jgi:hypothetical protein
LDLTFTKQSKKHTTGGFSYVYLVKDIDTVGLLGGSSQQAAAAKQQANGREGSPNRTGNNLGSGGEIPQAHWY